MITGIAIENFKGIRERVQLDLRPITLLFGANSAGKSTILHALHYAREVFERHNLNADHTVAGGKYIDLGGFEHFVHRRNKDDVIDGTKEMGLRVDLELTEADLPSFDADFDYMSEILKLNFGSFVKEVKSASVELTIGWSSVEKCPFVSTTKILLNNLELAQIVANPNIRGVVVKFSKIVADANTLNGYVEQSTLNHPCLMRIKDIATDEAQQAGLFEDESLLQTAISYCSDALSSGDQRIEISGKGDALPDCDVALDYDVEPTTAPEDAGVDLLHEPKANFVKELVAAVSDLIVGPCQLIRDQLKQFRYLGPLRETPPRNYEPPRFADPSRWASGLGAWDALHNGSEQLVNSVGEWLVAPDSLNAGCSIERRSFLELDLADPVVRKLINRRAFDELDEDEGIDLTKAHLATRIVVVPNDADIELKPHDVGIGISQVVPVIVIALDGEERLLAIEQPELHIHPRLQAEIADLFVEAIQSNKHRFIIETHSEHLILRLLRRIRETEDGTAVAHRQLRTDDVAVYYMKQENGCSTAMQIDVDIKGEFIQPWPDDFFEIDFYERFS
jgi:predicted ATPase